MNTLTIKPDRLKRLRAICLAFPDTSEKEGWGDPTWRVNDRIFAMQKGNYAGGRPSVWFKAPKGTQALVLDRDPERLFVPPYVGHKGWLGYYLDERIDWKLLADVIEDSYRAEARGASARRAASEEETGEALRRTPVKNRAVKAASGRNSPAR